MNQDADSSKVLPPRIPVPILGVPFDNITMTEAAELIERMIASRDPHYVVTPNVDFIVQAQTDVELRRLLFEADLVLCDGTPVVWISRLLNNPLPERVAGSDLVPLLIRIAARKGYRLFLLGASPAAANKAVKNLKEQFPELIIAGHCSPPFSHLLEMDHESIAQQIRRARPDILLVSLGCPKQEKWIGMHYRSLGVPVSIGVGATIDFLAGEMKRAPVWMQRSGTEWIFRMLQEPRRLFKRYAKDIWVFGWRILIQCWDSLSTKSAGEDRSADALEKIVPNGDDCVLNMNFVRQVDNRSCGALVRLQKTLRARGHQLILSALGKEVRSTLSRVRLADAFPVANGTRSAEELSQTFTSEQNAAVTPGPAPGTLLWRGEITAANASEVWAATCTRIASARQYELPIDLSRVRFIDSTGANIMLRACELAERKHLRLSFVEPQPAVQNVLRHARFETLVQQVSTNSGNGREATAGLVLSGQI